MYIKSIFVAAAVLLSGAAHAEDITVHGSTTVYSNLFGPHEVALEEKTGLNLTVVGNGSSRGIKGIDSGAAQIGMISSNLDGVLKKLDKEAEAANYIAEHVGEERIIVAVHSSNPVSSLSKEQVVSILKGETKNWSEVGGNNMPIVVVTEYAGGGLRTTVEKKLLAKEPMAVSGMREMPNGTQITKVVEQLPPAFAMIATATKSDKMKHVESDAEIVQPLILVVKGERTAAFDKLVEASKEILK